jgi:hypothetical protein
MKLTTEQCREKLAAIFANSRGVRRRLESRGLDAITQTLLDDIEQDVMSLMSALAEDAA